MMHKLSPEDKSSATWEIISCLVISGGFIGRSADKLDVDDYCQNPLNVYKVNRDILMDTIVPINNAPLYKLYNAISMIFTFF